MWNSSDASFADKDEREEEYKFYNFMNTTTMKYEKLKKYIKTKINLGYTVGALFGLGVCVFSIVLYRVLTIALKFEDGVKK